MVSIKNSIVLLLTISFVLCAANGRVCAQANQVTPNLQTTSDKNTQSSAILAIVNGHPITQSEFDATSIFPLGSIKDEVVRNQAKASILREMIDEHLVEQAIVETKLDQDPVFKSLLEREKRKAAASLFQVYQVSRMPLNLSTADVDAFIRSHKEYFSDRKTYHYIQFLIPPQSKDLMKYSVEDLREFTSKYTPSQFADWLNGQSIEFQRASFWQGSEQVSPTLLPEFAKLVSGSILVKKNNSQTAPSGSSNLQSDSFQVVYLIDSYPDPVNANDVRVSIAKNLYSLANKSKVSEIMQDLRAKAKVEVLDTQMSREINNLNVFDTSQASERAQSRRIMYLKTAWFFSMLCLIPVALLQFYRYLPSVSKTKAALRNIQELEQKSFIRFLEALFFGSLLLYPMELFLSSRLMDYSIKVIALSGLLGVTTACGLIYLIKKVPAMRELNQTRFFSIIVLLVAQYIVAAI